MYLFTVLRKIINTTAHDSPETTMKVSAVFEDKACCLSNVPSSPCSITFIVGVSPSLYIILYMFYMSALPLKCLEHQEQQLRGGSTQYDGTPSEKKWNLGRLLWIPIYYVPWHIWHTVGSWERGSWSIS